MNLYKRLIDDSLFCAKNKLHDPYLVINEIIDSIKKQYLIRRRKLSDREIRKILKNYIKKQEKIRDLLKNNGTLKYNLELSRINFNISITEIYISESVNKKPSIPKVETVDSIPIPPAKNL